MSTIAVFMMAGTWAIFTGTRFSVPCRVAILEPSAARMTLSRPRTGCGSAVGRLSKWLLADLAARPAPSTIGVTMPAAQQAGGHGQRDDGYQLAGAASGLPSRGRRPGSCIGGGGALGRVAVTVIAENATQRA